MGKKSLKVDEPIHERLEELQTEAMRKRGDKPSFEELIEAAVFRDPEEILVNHHVKKKTEKEKDELSIFDESFSL